MDRHARDYKNEKGTIFLTVATGESIQLHGKLIEQFELRGSINVDVTDNGQN